MFDFDTSLAELLYIFEVVLYYLIKDNRFVIDICVEVFIIKLGMKEVEFIVGACYLSKVDSIYQFRGLDYFCVCSVTKVAMPKLNLRIRAKTINRSASFLHKYYLIFKASFKHKEVFVPAHHSKCVSLLLEDYGVIIVIV